MLSQKGRATAEGQYLKRRERNRILKSTLENMSFMDWIREQ